MILKRESLVALCFFCLCASHARKSGFAQSVDRPGAAIVKRTDNYGDPLPEGAVARLGTVRLRQPFASCVAFSPDGKVLASGGADKRVILWDPATGKELRSFIGHSHSINALAFSMDGKLLASGSQGSEIRLWQVAMRQELRRMNHLSPVTTVAFSPDHILVASGGQDNAVRVWEVDSGKQLRCFQQEHGNYIHVVAFSPDGKLLAAARSNKKVDLWDVATWKPAGSLEGHKENVTGLAFAPDSRTLFTGAFDLTVRFWDVSSRKELRCLGEAKTNVSANDPLIQSLVVAPDGKTLAAGRHDGLILIWETRTGKELRRWKADHSYVKSLAFSPDSKVLASASSHYIRLWDPETGKRLDPFVDPLGLTERMVISPNGKILLPCYEDGALRIVEAASSRELASVALGPQGFADIAFSPECRLLALVEPPSLAKPGGFGIRLVDLATGQDKGVLVKQTRMIRYIAFSPRGDSLVGWDDKEFIVWVAITGEERKRFPGPKKSVFAFGYSPDGRLLATVGEQDAMALWDPATGKRLRGLGERKGWREILAFSPDSRTLALVGGDRPAHQDAMEIILWETATGHVRCRLTGHEHQALRAAFSPNGRIIASAAAEETIRVWDAPTGKQIGELTGHRGRVDSLAFLPNGKTLISGGVDRTILFWDMERFAPEKKDTVKHLGAEGLNSTWADLANSDAARAYRAIATLAEHPDETMSFLKASLPKGAKADSTVIARLIAELDDNQFAVREKASTELAKLGYRAEPALREALRAKASQEVQHRVNLLLIKLEDLATDPVKLRVLRAVEVLERIGTPEARQVLHGLEDAGEGPLSEEAKASLERLAKRAQAKP